MVVLTAKMLHIAAVSAALASYGSLIEGEAAVPPLHGHAAFPQTANITSPAGGAVPHVEVEKQFPVPVLQPVVLSLDSSSPRKPTEIKGLKTSALGLFLVALFVSSVIDLGRSRSESLKKFSEFGDHALQSGSDFAGKLVNSAILGRILFFGFMGIVFFQTSTALTSLIISSVERWVLPGGPKANALVHLLLNLLLAAAFIFGVRQAVDASRNAAVAAMQAEAAAATRS